MPLCILPRTHVHTHAHSLPTLTHMHASAYSPTHMRTSVHTHACLCAYSHTRAHTHAHSLPTLTHAHVRRDTEKLRQPAPAAGQNQLYGEPRTTEAPSSPPTTGGHPLMGPSAWQRSFRAALFLLSNTPAFPSLAPGRKKPPRKGPSVSGTQTLNIFPQPPGIFPFPKKGPRAHGDALALRRAWSLVTGTPSIQAWRSRRHVPAPSSPGAEHPVPHPTPGMFLSPLSLLSLVSRLCHFFVSLHAFPQPCDLRHSAATPGINVCSPAISPMLQNIYICFWTPRGCPPASL